MSKFYNVTVNGTVYSVEVEEIGQDSVQTAEQTAKPAPAKKVSAPVGKGTPVTAPMNGTILKLEVKVGDSVKKGDLICMLEAMKMENEIFASCDGTVSSVAVSVGQSVATGAVIATIA